MTEQTVYEVFGKYINGMGDIELYPGVYVNVLFFASLFKEASNPPTYAELMEIDGGTRGYAEFFTRSRDEGLFN